MGRIFYIFLLFILGFELNAQDDIYDAPESVKPSVVYSTQPADQRGDGSYENIDDSYNPDYDYRYRRSLRRMYDPDYVMPSSAFLNMYTYPQFANFYNPYWGWNSGFSITIGNTWGNPWAWNNPWGWNSWNNWYAWNNPWGWNTWGGGWNSWNNPWCGWNHWGGGWYDPYWGGGWNNSRWGGGHYQRSNYIDVSGRPAYSNAQLPQRNYPRANGRYQNPNNAGSGFYRNTPNVNSSSQRSGGGGTFNPPTNNNPSNTGGFMGGRSNNSSWGNGNNNGNGGSFGGSSASPSPSPSSSPSRGSAPRGGRF